MFRVLTTRFNETTFTFVKHHKALCVVAFVISTGLLCFHSFTIINRYLRHDVNLIETVFTQNSLQMPIVELWLNFGLKSSKTNGSFPPSPSLGKTNGSFPLQAFKVDINFSNPLLDGNLVEPWAYEQSVNQRQNDAIVSYVKVNQINRDYLQNYSISIENFLPQWPLKSNRFNNFNAGIYIEAMVNAKNLIDFEDETGESGQITVRINPFQAGLGILVGLPQYEILPCEELSISLTLERYQLQNRSNSPCRDEYPQYVADFIKNSDAKNLTFAYQLPYDPAVCKMLCKSKYLLDKCKCFFSFDAWIYAGKPNDIELCSAASPDPSTDCGEIVLENCSCHAKCNQTVVRINEVQKFSHAKGHATIYCCIV